MKTTVITSQGIVHPLKKASGFGIHINTNPNGTYSFVGSVPTSLMGWRIPTQADIMGDRVDPATGKAHFNRVFKTVIEMVELANSIDVQLCTNANCACRKLFCVTDVATIAPFLDENTD